MRGGEDARDAVTRDFSGEDWYLRAEAMVLEEWMLPVDMPRL